MARNPVLLNIVYIPMIPKTVSKPYQDQYLVGISKNSRQNRIPYYKPPSHTIRFLCFLMLVYHTIMCPVPQIKT